MVSTESIKCNLCQDNHVLDKYNWVDGCRGYMALGDFELIIKMETGEDVEIA